MFQIIDQIARYKHYRLRIVGYLDFYKKTQVHHRLPLYIVSLLNAIILIIQALIQQFYPDNFAEKCVKGGTMSPIAYLCAFITVEFCLIAGININYIGMFIFFNIIVLLTFVFLIVKVSRFNRQKAPPDVQKEEWNACAAPEAPEVGSRLEEDKLYDFLEKQADMIRFLKEHNAKLGEKLMIMSAQVQARGHQESQ